ncbi:MAG: ABC transporter ATP-binding protein [Bosea sp.]|nr:ABC transporter ATP-binding protein [Bosea sp. (in: a-proteobacteria)]MCP4738228.1 ABC transporter ATP-binding protein [Bosea sp. (in: a-proteobacteria)]
MAGSQALHTDPPHRFGDVLVRVSGVRKHYGAGGDQRTVAIGEADLEIRRGEFLAIVGPSGCGKSTLLQIIAGLSEASAGEVTLDGRRVTAPPPDAVYLFQQYAKSLFPWRTVRRNVTFALEHKPVTAAERKRDAESLLERVGLGEFADHYPWQLSGGMQQRVAIARALAARPRLLLMDEPFSAVDALTRVELQALILDIWSSSEDLTVVLVTHDVDEAVYLADRIAILGRRPSRIDDVIEIGLPRPRHAIETREDSVYLKHRHALLNRLLDRPL